MARSPKVQAPPTVEPHVERPGPAEFRDPFVIRELQRATVWFGVALLIWELSVRHNVQH